MIDFTTSVGQVRLLLNDVDETRPIFRDNEIQAFLTMEGDVVKLAAAQAIDTNASNEVLASKVLKSQDKSTDGAKAADALHAHAKALREQYYRQTELALETDGGGCFVVADSTYCVPELTERDWLPFDVCT
jgi:hypothetical protein